MIDDVLDVFEDARLEEQAAIPVEPKKKRKKSTPLTARTLAECRKRGWIAQVVERRIPFPKPQGTTIDLFGVIDVVAINTDTTIECFGGCGRHQRGRIVGIQACAATDHARRRAKILAEPRMQQWTEAGCGLELWSWSKRGGSGTRKLWTLRVETYAEMVAGAGSEAA